MITNIYIITGIAVIGGGLFGFDESSMSAILNTQSYKCYFNQGPAGRPFNDNRDCSGPTPNVQGGITAAMPGGSFVGSLASGFISDRFGRKTSIQVGALVWCVGCVIVCAAQNIPMLIVGRFINGFSVGICSSQVPVYVSELAPPQKRGRLVAAQQWAITWGILIMYYLCYACSFIRGTASFRVPWGLQMLPAIFLFIGLLFLPESPRYLARKDRWEECHQILALVHGRGDRNADLVRKELAEIHAVCESERENAATYLELFTPKLIYRTHLGVFTQIWSQLTGINAMMYYITYIFAMAGLKGNVNLYSASIQYVINVLMTIPALIWIDRWGRRNILIVGAMFMMIWMFANAGVLAVYGHQAPPGGLDNVAAQSWEVHGPASKASIAFTYLFVASFAPSIGPVSWIYPPELFPLRVRGKAASLCTGSNWIFNFALSYFVPPAFVSIKWKVYLLFGVFCATMMFHFLIFYPETAGKTLEEVEEMFLLDIKPWKTKVQRAQDLWADPVILDLGNVGHPEKAEHSEHVEKVNEAKAEP